MLVSWFLDHLGKPFRVIQLKPTKPTRRAFFENFVGMTKATEAILIGSRDYFS